MLLVIFILLDVNGRFDMAVFAIFLFLTTCTSSSYFSVIEYIENSVLESDKFVVLLQVFVQYSPEH